MLLLQRLHATHQQGRTRHKLAEAGVVQTGSPAHTHNIHWLIGGS